MCPPSSAGPGSVIQFPLNRGEVVEVVGTSSADLSGTLLQATAPVQVISGIPCTDIPQEISAQCPDQFGAPSYCQACDHIFEQMVPTDRWGTNFHTILFNGVTSSTYRVVADQAGTQVMVNGALVATLNAGLLANAGKYNLEIDGGDGVYSLKNEIGLSPTIKAYSASVTRQVTFDWPPPTR